MPALKCTLALFSTDGHRIGLADHRTGISACLAVRGAHDSDRPATHNSQTGSGRTYPSSRGRPARAVGSVTACRNGQVGAFEGGTGTTGNTFASRPHHAEYALSPNGFVDASKSPSSALSG